MIGRHILAWLAGMQLRATIRFLRVFTAERVRRSGVRRLS